MIAAQSSLQKAKPLLWSCSAISSRSSCKWWQSTCHMTHPAPLHSLKWAPHNVKGGRLCLWIKSSISTIVVCIWTWDFLIDSSPNPVTNSGGFCWMISPTLVEATEQVESDTTSRLLGWPLTLKYNSHHPTYVCSTVRLYCDSPKWLCMYGKGVCADGISCHWLGYDSSLLWICFPLKHWPVHQKVNACEVERSTLRTPTKEPNSTKGTVPQNHVKLKNNKCHFLLAWNKNDKGLACCVSNKDGKLAGSCLQDVEFCFFFSMMMTKTMWNATYSISLYFLQFKKFFSNGVASHWHCCQLLLTAPAYLVKISLPVKVLHSIKLQGLDCMHLLPQWVAKFSSLPQGAAATDGVKF